MTTGTGSSGGRWGRALRGLLSGTRPALRPGASRPLPEQPLLSVVVPVYQVEAYLAECLDSLTSMRYRNVEIIVVDDGSTDGSAAIAERYRAQDERIRVVRQENAGLGAARNRGIREATGDLVTFVDSDDTVTANGYAKMVRILGQTGSDFAVGSLRRQVRGRYLERHWLRRLHAEQRLAITIDDAPDMLGNIWAVTKVFRRDFLERIGLEFPVGVRYEDQVPITRAYLEARSFDVITEPVYLWRTRAEGTSITQQKHHAADLRDRLAAKQQVADLLDQGASPRVVGHWFAKVFRLDLPPYYRAALASADESYWAVLTTATAWLVEHAPERTWDELELRFRVTAHLAARRDREGLRRFLGVPQLDTSNFEVRNHDGALVADLGPLGRDEADAEELLRLRDVDLPSTSQLDEVTWSPSGEVELRGSALIRHLSPAQYDVRTRLELRPPGWSSAAPLPVATQRRSTPEANRFARRVYEDHENSGFTASFALADVVAASDARRPTLWRAAVHVEAVGVQRNGWFVQRNDAGTARARHAAVVDDALVIDSWDRRRGWGVNVHRRYAAVLDARLDDGALVARVRVGRRQTVSGLTVGEEPVPVEVRTDPGAPDVVTLRVDVADLAHRPPGALRVTSDDPGLGDVERAKGLPLVVVGDLDWVPAGDGAGLALVTAGDRGLQVVPRGPHLLLAEVAFGDEAVTVRGTAHDVGRFTIGLTGDRVDGTSTEVDARADGSFEAEVPTTATAWDGSRTVLCRDAYQLTAACDGVEVTVRASSRLQREAPAQSRGWRVRVSGSRVLGLRRVKDLDPGVATAYGRQVLRRTVYAEARRQPRRDAVVFESFAGTSTGDSPGAVCRALLDQSAGLELLWSVADEALPVPAGTRRLLQGSPEWFEALGTARFVITNGLLPPWFERADGQTLVQTWRGQPLRRLGPDVNDPRALDEDDDVLARQAAQWSLLAAPSAFAARTLGPALGVAGRTVEVGSPRNDVLLGGAADRVRADVRRRLGLGPDQRAVLYAPTWREYARVDGHHEKVLFLDAAALTTAHEDVVLLVRGHPNTAAAPTVRGERVLDVTTYPDAAELYLAADVLVSDYSSVVFDFALTDKPIVLLAPDLEEYQLGDRGLYVDLPGDPPGPLVRTTAELLEVLADASVPDRWADARRRVRETYGALEDGHATQRLLPLVFGESSR